MDKINVLMLELLKQVEESGVIESDNYHSIQLGITKPMKWGAEGSVPEVEVVICGYEKGHEGFNLSWQNNGYGPTVESALLDLSLRFAKRK